MQVFRERLNQLLIESGKTVKDFAAEVVRASRQSVGYYLNGNRAPDSETLREICENCHVSADWLLGLSDIRNPEKDFQTACATFGLSETAGNTLLNHKSKELTAFLELGSQFWDDFLGEYGFFLKYKEQMVSDMPMQIELRENQILLNEHGAVKFITSDLGQSLSKMLYEIAVAEVKKNGES